MTQPDVTLTDYALAVECAVFCVLAARWTVADARLRRWWIVFFASVAVSAAVGGTVHGFFSEPGTGNAILWRATLLSIGVTSMAAWIIGSTVQLREPVATWVRRAAVAQFIAYAAVVLFVDSRFIVAIATYLPATMFLLVVMILAYKRSPTRSLSLGITGLVLTFVAAAVQQSRIAIHPVYFNHNALYHLIQGVALLLLFLGAKGVTLRKGSS